jgi:hypothetical protein
MHGSQPDFGDNQRTPHNTSIFLTNAASQLAVFITKAGSAVFFKHLARQTA